jgi:hypothetical protein
MRALAFFFVLPLAVTGCWDSTFHCTVDDQCVLHGVAGRCETTGYCSFPSASCPSGSAYGSHSPLSGMCVPATESDMAEPPPCGNGMLDPGEQCDPMIVAPNEGVCPATSADCDDHNPCTADSVDGTADACTARCVHPFITSCSSGDQCCPTGCTPVSDSDCSATCGNGSVEGAEKCDKAIAAGLPGACPTSCPPKSGCVSYMLIGSASVCTAQCVMTTTTTCSGALASDGCCPPGCSVLNDGDCV